MNILWEKEFIWAALQAAYLVNFNWRIEAVKSISKFIFLKVNCYEKVNKHDCIKWSSWNKIINLITIRVKKKQSALYIIFGGILFLNNPGIIFSLLNFYHYYYSYIEIKQVTQMNSVKRCHWHAFVFNVSLKYFQTQTNLLYPCSHYVKDFIVCHHFVLFFTEDGWMTTIISW